MGNANIETRLYNRVKTAWSPDGGSYSFRIGLKKIIAFLFVFLATSCVEKNEPKIIILKEEHKQYLENIISSKKYDAEIIDSGNYWVIKYISEKVLLDIIGIIHLRMDIIAENLANVNTTRIVDGGPFIRKTLRITSEKGVEIIQDTESQLKLRYEPNHPDAIKEGEKKGYVQYPNVEILTEKADMAATSHLYDSIVEYLKEKYKTIIL